MAYLQVWFNPFQGAFRPNLFMINKKVVFHLLDDVWLDSFNSESFFFILCSETPAKSASFSVFLVLAGVILNESSKKSLKLDDFK